MATIRQGITVQCDCCSANETVTSRDQLKKTWYTAMLRNRYIKKGSLQLTADLCQACYDDILKRISFRKSETARKIRERNAEKANQEGRGFGRNHG